MKFVILFLLLNFPLAVFSQETRLAQIVTGNVASQEGFTFSGGNLLKSVTLNHTAFLIKHGDEYIMFDAGLGKKIDDQFKKDMPWWGKLIFSYKKTKSASEQLAENGIKVNRIFLSHLHWDHASGLVDFSEAKFLLPKDELGEISDPAHPPKAGAFFKSQFDFKESQWQNYAFTPENYMGFEESYDVFGDKSVVIVPLPGHTKGSVGVIVNTGKKKYFLVGDLIWKRKALENLSPKFFVPACVVDGDPEELLKTMKKLLSFSQKYPDVEIVPAHDEEVQAKYPYFPSWSE